MTRSGLPTMRAVYFEEPGEADVLKMKDILRPKPRKDEVLIQVVAVGVNKEDLFRRKTGFDPVTYANPVLGHECAGVIVERGAEVKNFEVSDKVCAVVRGGGAYAEFVVVPASSVIRYPDCLKEDEAASLPQAMCLVLYCFNVLRKLKNSDTILIHGASGGVGVIALQYAKAIGCDVYVTVGTNEKMMACKDLGATDCFNRNRVDFCKCVKSVTGDAGVNFILDVNGSEYFQKNLDCLAKGGSLFVIGCKSGCGVNLDFSVMRNKDVAVIGASLLSLPLEDLSRLLMQVQHIFWPLIENRKIRPVIGKTFRFSDAASAHRTLESGTVFGKVILTPDGLENK